jgi:hypothetical protein
MNILWDVILLPWFGHGRMMECYLTIVCLAVTCIILIAPEQTLHTDALFDIGWSFNARYIAIPFALKTVLSGAGLICNVNNLRGSQALRFAGGLVGFIIWFWLSTKFILLNSFLLAWPFCVAAAYSSIRIMAFALVDLPRSGTPGNYA